MKVVYQRVPATTKHEYVHRWVATQGDKMFGCSVQSIFRRLTPHVARLTQKRAMDGLFVNL